LKIGLLMSQVPFIRGGAEILADQLKSKLELYGHQAEIISIPFKWYPISSLYNSMMMGRMMEIQESAYQKVDGVIGLKFPAYYAAHTNKVMWLVHQHRQAYDLWGTKFGDLHQNPDGEKIKKFIIESDNLFIPEYKNRYTISKNVSQRLQKNNNISSTALYHPPHDHEKLHCSSFQNYVFYPSRIDQMKRQWLLVEAAKFLKTDVKIKIAGTGSQDEMDRLKKLISENKLENRVSLLGRVSDQEKVDLLANCLCVYNGVYDEDYGYVTLEGFFAHKPVIVHEDAGGPTEFIEQKVNGYILDLKPETLASQIDELSMNRQMAEKMGEHGYQSLLSKKVSWENTIEHLVGGLK
jgi:glycosyltransferase involved in cell wall biosynthesis